MGLDEAEWQVDIGDEEGVVEGRGSNRGKKVRRERRRAGEVIAARDHVREYYSHGLLQDESENRLGLLLNEPWMEVDQLMPPAASTKKTHSLLNSFGFPVSIHCLLASCWALFGS